MKKNKATMKRLKKNTVYVSVLGLGEMGTAIAQTFVNHRYHTTVWNRSANKCAPLVEAGASAVATTADAVAASSLVVICLLDNTVVDEVLRPLESNLESKVLVPYERISCTGKGFCPLG
ncbi:3-hydroxyisobutyrate dehydrogenase-like beta-hydroxyacid dehydrogenase [Algoriphagus sp. 4150]|uniref:NAD(P)-binding domain-containing protein n=1 Tax=Algoriphagus sp. 4150 TaxID=2817756 RepID=UPI0028615B87|nr:NAD(P)-binding domain-containing protein [Algoriphagus sp. 4150]MDR7129734.1 3-hydroxyisobutyrate dehydrogenase-like beta-hydroxyacid dehydrogenase [Algoriphagus sp. 4150]